MRNSAAIEKSVMGSNFRGVILILYLISWIKNEVSYYIYFFVVFVRI